MTVLTEIPLEFESYLRDKTLQNLPTNLNEFIFAYIPNLDLSVDIDRNSTIPSENLIVHRAPVANVGKTGKNAIVYSAIIDSTVTEFTFNAIYLHDKNEANACGMIIHQQDETKQQAMTITKSALMQYDSAAASAHVTVDAETWQVDISDLFAACSKVGHTHTLNEVGGSNKNYFVNGDFSIWQRGHSFDFSNNLPSDNITADCWQSNMKGATVSFTNTSYYAGTRMNAINIVRSGEGEIYSLTQFVENGLDIFYNKTATVSFVCYSSVDGQLQLVLYSDRLAKSISFSPIKGFAVDGYFNVRKGYNRIELTISDIGRNLADDEIVKTCEHLRVYPATEIGTCLLKNTGDSVRFARMKFELGEFATPFVPDHPSINLAKCQRHYSGQLAMSFVAGSSGFHPISLTFPASMLITPAITIQSLSGKKGTVSHIQDSGSSVGSVVSVSARQTGIFRIQATGLTPGQQYMCDVFCSTGL